MTRKFRKQSFIKSPYGLGIQRLSSSIRRSPPLVEIGSLNVLTGLAKLISTLIPDERDLKQAGSEEMVVVSDILIMGKICPTVPQICSTSCLH